MVSLPQSNPPEQAFAKDNFMRFKPTDNLSLRPSSEELKICLVGSNVMHNNRGLDTSRQACSLQVAIDLAEPGLKINLLA